MFFLLPFLAWFVIGIFGAAIFILIQLVLLVDFAHSWNESWVKKMEEGNSKCWYAGRYLNLWRICFCWPVLCRVSLTSLQTYLELHSRVSLSHYCKHLELIAAVLLFFSWNKMHNILGLCLADLTVIINNTCLVCTASAEIVAWIFSTLTLLCHLPSWGPQEVSYVADSGYSTTQSMPQRMLPSWPLNYKVLIVMVLCS